MATDLSGIRDSLYGGSSMAIGSTAPVPDFGAHGSDSQDAPDARLVPDPADASPVDVSATEWGTPDVNADNPWQRPDVADGNWSRAGA
jgi:hypothetical protein